MIERLLTAEVFALLLIFCRLGSAIILLPGIGENYVSARIRLLLAGAIVIVVAPVVAPNLPRMPSNPVSMALLVGSEIGIGLFIGSVVRLMVTGLEIAGTLISFQIGLATASILNPLLSDQGSVVSVLIAITGMLLIFQTDLHHLMIRGLIDSYGLFVPGALPPVGDMTETITRMVSRSFVIGMQLSAPLLIISTLLYIALGLIARLMPQLQVFFVALPLQIILGFLILVGTFSTLMLWFLDGFSTVLKQFLAPT